MGVVDDPQPGEVGPDERHVGRRAGGPGWGHGRRTVRDADRIAVARGDPVDATSTAERGTTEFGLGVCLIG
jgi:hypothetical protein